MTISWTINTKSGASDCRSMIGGAMQRQDHQCQHQRDCELDADRNIGLAQSRQQHHHRADAGEYQHKGGGERGQQ
jgi:hypothetical protein